jgi:hypothetical protein
LETGNPTPAWLRDAERIDVALGALIGTSTAQLTVYALERRATR